MTLVLGVDSSTQSTKALLVDADDGTVVDSGRAPHPHGTEVDPRAWLAAYDEATATSATRAAAIAVGGQQHGMVALDAQGEPVRDALLWNDTRSAGAARQLIAEMGGDQACADAVGSVLVASFTASKLRWMRDAEPAHAAATERVLLPHDYVSWHACGRSEAPFTDRGDASGTGYYSPAGEQWRPDLAERAVGRAVELPRIAPVGSVAATTAAGQAVAPGTGDNMAAALALDLRAGDVVVSVGTSGVASVVSTRAVQDGTGVVTGFSDATGAFLPLVVTMNCARILDLQASLLGVDLDTLSDLALSAPVGAGGLVLSPYYGGERTPNLPDAVGTWTGLTTSTSRADLARAAFEALLCSLADAVDRLVAVTGQAPRRLVLVGGATRSPALRALAPAILEMPVTVPQPDEYVALGAARQAAWALAGTPEPPVWAQRGTDLLEADPTPRVRAAYTELRDRTETWSAQRGTP